MSAPSLPHDAAGPRRSRTAALLVTAACVVVAVGAVVLLTDAPVRDVRGARSPGRTRAAVALRDHVIPFQKFGTKLFTLPVLEANYDRVAYFTQYSRRDKQGDIVASFEELLRAHDEVDVFLLAHSNLYVAWLRELPPELRGKLRLVYNTGCADAYQADAWLALGARAYVGHPGQTSVSPVFYVYFLRRWAAGAALEDAVEAANAETARRLRLPGLADSRDPDRWVRETRAVASGPGELTIGGRR